MALSLYNLAVQAKRTAAWLPEGLPCEETDAAIFAGDARNELRRFEYGGVTFGRQTGHVACETLLSWASEFVGCRFTSPRVVSVTREGRTRYFAPGPGASAAVMSGSGKLVCVRVG